MNVVIVESPAKAKTINKYLGNNYTVLASYGHVRDLPSKNGSVDPDNDFAMKWEADPTSKKRLNEIASAVKGSDTLYLATDPDREGEAISWHVLKVLEAKKALKGVKVKRVAFNEITKSAILNAMAAPREINQELVEAYLARRALDYLVGFTLSPVLWRKLPGARSAGRVQSVSLRIICDREREIEIFDPQEYWSVLSNIKSEAGDLLTARLYSLNGKTVKKHDHNNEAAAMSAVEAIKNSEFKIASVQKKPTKRNPYAPFITSTLQQDAARKFGFTARHTMGVAQALYEGKTINGEPTGLITYMRTDGVTMAGEAINASRQVIAENYGKNYVPDSPRVYKSKVKNAQEGHEAIRPTNFNLPPSSVKSVLDTDEYRLYELIWKRTLACQMASAQMEQTSIDIANADSSVNLRLSGTVVVFDGFLKLYQESVDEEDKSEAEARLPVLKEGEKIELICVDPKQHFTDPPPRFSEASLVKKMEELGIGRPSTYASTLSVLRERNYVTMENKRFVPEDKGQIVTAFLEAFFGKYVEYDFTAELEEELDLISAGGAKWIETLEKFWKPFHNKTEEVMEIRTKDILDALNDYLAPHIFKQTEEGVDPRKCPTCDDGMLSLKTSKHGAFIGCTNYPECSFTRKMSGNGDSSGLEGGNQVLGIDPESKLEVTLRDGRFGPYLQIGEMEKGVAKPPRASIPKDLSPDLVDFAMALKLLSLPREVGTHPETGKMIKAAIGRFGPYLNHDGAYASLSSTEEVFNVGANRAVTLLAEAKLKKKGPQALKELGKHPDDEGLIQVMDGRYGPYVKHGKTNATLPKGVTPEGVTLEEAIALINAKVAKGGKKPAKKKAAKKKAPAKKKTPAKKKAAAKKPASKKKAK
jgi:DNA topoisomerase-1